MLKRYSSKPNWNLGYGWSIGYPGSITRSWTGSWILCYALKAISIGSSRSNPVQERSKGILKTGLFVGCATAGRIGCWQVLCWLEVLFMGVVVKRHWSVLMRVLQWLGSVQDGIMEFSTCRFGLVCCRYGMEWCKDSRRVILIQCYIP